MSIFFIYNIHNIAKRLLGGGGGVGEGWAVDYVLLEGEVVGEAADPWWSHWQDCRRSLFI